MSKEAWIPISFDALIGGGLVCGGGCIAVYETVRLFLALRLEEEKILGYIQSKRSGRT